MQQLFRFWPGFTGLVRYGQWSFLAIALSFALLLDLLLALNFLWTEYISSGQRNFLLLGLLGTWGALFAISAQMQYRIETTRSADADSTGFKQAISHYLKGNWFEAQCSLNLLLQKNPRDAEALLMLATIQRHSQLFDDASATLGRLEMIDEGNRWFIEIETEKQLLEAQVLQAKKHGEHSPEV